MPVLSSLPIAAQGLAIGKARLPLTYSAGLEYSPPARGNWTIMHLGLLIPETHIIFVCARCCLRGVSMSAAELRAMDRFSTITIEDCNLLEGDTEKALIEGVSDILSHLPKRPRGVIIFTSCVHEFIGSDLTFSFEVLRQRFPDITFTDGYMTPILRKRITPDKRNRRQILTLLKPANQKDAGVTLVGDVRPKGVHSDYRAMAEASGRPWRSITATRTWEEYQALARSSLVVSDNPTADAALEWMQTNLSQSPLQLTTPWRPEDIDIEKKRFAEFLNFSFTEDEHLKSNALAALARAQANIGDTPVAVDFTATTRPLSLVRLLLETGFNVTSVYLDGVLSEEKTDFAALQAARPDLMLYPTTACGMVKKRTNSESRLLAVGQKAAWFEHTNHFVNIVEGDGADGYRAIAHLAELLEDAFLHPKCARDVIQVKALGCTKGGCL